MSVKLKDVTERQIQRELMIYMGANLGQCEAYPNMMHGAFERDILRLMRSGHWHEIEIKRTVADFRADFKKAYAPICFLDQKERTKHEVMQSGDFSNTIMTPYYQNQYVQPKRFYFALPMGVVNSDEVPEPYGILRYYITERMGLLRVKTERPAKDLPNPQKIDEETRNRFMVSIYYRFWKYFAANEKGE